MAEIINMPRLSDTMEEGLATWFKKVGDTVKEGDILAEINNKATMEFEAFYEGELYIGIRRRNRPSRFLISHYRRKREKIFLLT